MPRVINRASGGSIGRGLPISSQIQRKSNPPQQAGECQKNPDSLACLQEQLDNLRSSGNVLTRRSDQTPADPQLGVGGGFYLNVIGGQTQALEKQIEKKSWRRI